MAKNEKDATCIELPSEILFEIFLRLSVKPLLRFKCVCKSWCSFFQDPSFITMHLNNHVSRNDNGYVIYRDFAGGRFSYCRGNFVRCEKFIMPSGLLSSHFQIVGSSNGLVCLKELDNFPFDWDIFSLWIWNPSLGKIMAIPEDYHHYDSVSNGVGFGFCPKSNDYKIVKISGLHRRAGIGVPPTVSVYTLSTNSWKQIQGAVPAWSFGHWYSTVCINGALHWPALDQGSSSLRCLLSSFRLDEEVFVEIRQPNYGSDHGYGIDTVAPKDYKNMLSLICQTGQIYDIWVMEEYGVADSWVKQFTFLVSPPTRLFHFHLGNDGEILLIKNGRLLSYDTESKQFKDQGLEVSVKYIIGCKESLVSFIAPS